MTLLLLLIGACSTEPQRDENTCWSNDREIWLTLWDEWCGALDGCGSFAEYSSYSDLDECRDDVRSRIGSPQATCLDGCEMDACLEEISLYAGSCAMADLTETPPGFCGVVLANANGECEP